MTFLPCPLRVGIWQRRSRAQGEYVGICRCFCLSCFTWNRLGRGVVG